MTTQLLYKVKTPVFEGPLDLLLSLVEKRKLFINDVSLAQVTDDFIVHVKSVENFGIGETASFILIASTLLLIKSKSLLPTLELTLEEEENIKDLETRLKIYQRMKELSVGIQSMFGKKILFAKENTKIDVTVFSPDTTMTVPNLGMALFELLQNLPKKEALPKAMVRKVVSLEETITSLTERINTNLRMSFREFANVSKEEKVTVIVSFLAMLELVKQGIITVLQDEHFNDIKMETTNLEIPRYN